MRSIFFILSLIFTSSAQEQPIDVNAEDEAYRLLCAADAYHKYGCALRDQERMMRRLIRIQPESHGKRSNVATRKAREKAYALAKEAEAAFAKASELAKKSLEVSGFSDPKPCKVPTAQ